MATETVKVICLGCGRELVSQPYQASESTLRIDTLPCKHCLDDARQEGKDEEQSRWISAVEVVGR